MSFFTVLSLCLFADEGKYPPQKNFFSNILSLNINSYTYKEPNFMKLTGINGGIDYIAALNFDSGLFLRGDVLFNKGKNKYTSNGTGAMRDDPSWYVDSRIMLGAEAKLSNGRIAPYVGFGYRYLNNNSSGRKSSTGAESYLRINKLMYVPAGVTYGFEFNNGHSIETTAEYDYVIKGKQFSGINGLGANGHSTYSRDSNVTQPQGFGLRLSSDYVIGSWAFGPYGRYWKIEDSLIDQIPLSNMDIQDDYEPENNTLEIGFKVSFRF